jgi:hypothetical protein
MVVVELNTKDLLQVTSILLVGGGVLWRFSSLLGDIKTDLHLINQKLSQIIPKLDDHETRIRQVEKLVAEKLSAKD